MENILITKFVRYVEPRIELLFDGQIILICKLTFYCSMFPKSTHETFANKLYQTFKNHKRFVKPKLSRTDFAIAHYAGEVCF